MKTVLAIVTYLLLAFVLGIVLAVSQAPEDPYKFDDN